VGAGETEYVLSALNNGIGGTGTNLLAEDVTINSSMPLVIDTSSDLQSNADHKADANIVGGIGTALTSTKVGSQHIFLPTVTPTYGVYNGSTDPNNGFDSTFVSIAAVGTNNVYGDANLAPTIVQLGSNIGTSSGNNYLSSQTGGVDPAFLNGTVTSMRIVSAYASASFKGPSANVTAVPFANIVVPNGASGTVSGSLAGDQGAIQPFSIQFPAQILGPSMQLASSAIAGATTIGTITMTGPGHGNYNSQTVAVSSPAQVSGALTVNGFTAGDQEIYGLAIGGTAESTAALVAQLNAAVALADAGAVAVPTSTLSASLQSVLAGDQIAVLFPGADAGSPNIFSYDLNGGATGETITSITVVPEPTGIGALVLGGLGLLGRRKRRMA
jgi:hypothetical protein